MASCCKHWSTMRTWLRSLCRSSWQICSATGAGCSTRTTLWGKASRPCSKSRVNGANNQKSSSLCNSRWSKCRERTKECTLKCIICVSRPSQSSTPTSLPRCTTRMTMLHEETSFETNYLKKDVTNKMIDECRGSAGCKRCLFSYN